MIDPPRRPPGTPGRSGRPRPPPWTVAGAALALVLAVVAGCAARPARAAVRSPTELSGDFLQVALPLAAFNLPLARDDREGQRQFWQGFLTTGVVTHVLKKAVPEQRPNGGQESFVSGHTSAAFSGAAFIQLRYGWAYGAPAYLAAAYTGYTRVAAEKHYWEDVGRGAAIAILAAWVFTTPYPTGVALAPLAAPGYAGVWVGLRW